MAPRIFSRLFSIKEHGPPYPRRISPNAIGISDSTCEVNGDPFNKWKLPIPLRGEGKKERTLTVGARTYNPQNQCLFFHKLPAEIRQLIYLELLGGRRVHVDYGFKLSSPFQAQAQAHKKQRRQRYWYSWHIVCNESDSFAIDQFYDNCDRCYQESDDAERFGLTAPLPGTKLGGVEWLRTCQIAYRETLPILYGTNVFALTSLLDTPFHMSRLLLPAYASLILSMDVYLQIGSTYTEPPMITGLWTDVYPAFFRLFQHTFRNVRRLRLTMNLKPWDIPPVTMNDANLDAFLAPWETLARSREWIYLDLAIQDDWYPFIKKKADAQSTWTLSRTDFYEIGACDSNIIL